MSVRRLVSLAVACLMVAGMLGISFFASGVALADYSWSDTRGPGDGDATALAQDQARNILYRGTRGRGVYRYRSGAWSAVGGLPAGTGVSALVYDKDRNLLYAGILGSGVWRCKNPDSAAPVWERISSAVDIGARSVYSLVHDRSRNLIYAGVSGLLFGGDGVWRCDGPASVPTWTRIYQTGEPEDTRLFVTSALVFDGTRNLLYAGFYEPLYTGKGVWRCANPDTSSHNWARASGSGDVGDMVVNSLGIDEAGSILYAGPVDGFAGKGVWRCANADASPSWTDIGGSLAGRGVSTLTYDAGGNVLYACTSGVWRCPAPGGGSPAWTEITTKADLSGHGIGSLYYDGARSVLYVGAMGLGVWACASPATSPRWSATGGGLSGVAVKSFVVDSSRGLLYAGAESIGVWRYGGPAGAPRAWTSISSIEDVGGLNITSMAYDSNKNIIYAGTNFGVWRCARPNTSPSWEPISAAGDVGTYALNSIALDTKHDVLYAAAVEYNLLGATGKGVWRCRKPGSSHSWSNMSAGGAVGNLITNSLAFDGARNVLYAGTHEPLYTGKGVWRCKLPDGSSSWSKIAGSSNVGDLVVNSLAFDRSRNLLYAGTQSGAWRCSNPDAGPAWKKISATGNIGNHTVYSLALDPDRNVLYAGTSSRGAWRCDTPNANSYQWLYTGGSLGSYEVHSFGFDGSAGRVYAGTLNAGVWQASYPAITGCTPSGAKGGDTLDVVIEGANTNFQAWESEASFGPGITVNSLSVTNGRKAKANITVAADAGTGARDVNVTTGKESPDALSGGFVVTASTWYLAEGSSSWGFDTYVTMANPNDAQVTARVTYMTPAGPIQRPDIALPPLSQTVINPRNDLGSTDFSTEVECIEGKSIAVDRRMIWTGPGAASSEGHASVGVNFPAETWYLPEGSSNWGFECWLLIQNPNDTPTGCQITYMIEGEGPVTVQKSVQPNSRATFNMADDIGAKDASIKVESGAPVIAERAMYRNNRRSGHNSTGATTPAAEYFLAEGTVGWGFTTYVLVQNPNPEEAKVTLTYMTGDGPVEAPAFKMPPSSRRTINVNETGGLADPDFSTHVSADMPIIAERAMYWSGPTGEACHDSVGMAAPHTTFCLPDGETYGDHETWTLVQNPNDEDVEIEVKYLVPTGEGNKTVSDTVPANSRKSFFMADDLPQSRASIVVTSKTPGAGIMVERAMYWNSRGAGTDTIGGVLR